MPTSLGCCGLVNCSSSSNRRLIRKRTGSVLTKNHLEKTSTPSRRIAEVLSRTRRIMRPVSVGVCITLALASACMAQEHEWEVGAAAGFGFMHNATINNPTGSVSAGFDNRFAAGVVIGQELYQHFGGELRYTFRDNDLVLKGTGEKVNMDGDSHLVHYDLLVHAAGKSTRIRPFAAAGGGIRLFGGTGHEYAHQPFGDFALLT